VYVPGTVMQTESLPVGIPFVQLAATPQSPLAGFVQLSLHPAA